MIKGVTFDFYETLIHSRDYEGRGDLFHKYLATKGFSAEVWKHQVLYDVFNYYYEAYTPKLSDKDKEQFWEEFTIRLFERTKVIGEKIKARVCSKDIRQIFGPAHFVLYPEVHEVLQNLKNRGLILGIISNWQKGLSCFCAELGILDYFKTIISSDEIGIEKPDQKIFIEAAQRLNLPAKQILHVGDHEEDDMFGAKRAGFHTVLVKRENGGNENNTVNNLLEVVNFI